MKTEVKIFVCGNKNATPCTAWCFPGDQNCNNYCNYDHSKPMADGPKTFETIVWEEIDHWKDVIDMLAEYLPQDGFTIYDKLMAKYKITLNHEK
jgi:hypothetical protein